MTNEVNVVFLPPHDQWDQSFFIDLTRRGGHGVWDPADGLLYAHWDADADGWPTDADGVVCVVPGRYHHSKGAIADLSARLAIYRWVLLVVTSDEERLMPWWNVEHPYMRVWVQTPDPQKDSEADIVMPVGYSPHTAELVRSEETDAQAGLQWFFAGQVTHKRRQDAATAMAQLNQLQGEFHASPGFTQGFDRATYLRQLTRVRYAPCPSGPVNVDTFRIWEALEAGALPIVDTRTPDRDMEEYWRFSLGRTPFPTVRSWQDLSDLIELLEDMWPLNVVHARSWWMLYKRRMAYSLDRQVRLMAKQYARSEEPNDVITVIITTSPMPSNPSLHIIQETIFSVRERLPFADIIISADGDPTFGEDHNYALYLHDLTWWCMGQHNIAVHVADKWMHQAELTRTTLRHVRTPLLLFMEHDTPLVGELPLKDIVGKLHRDDVDVVRLLHQTDIHPEHQHLMLDKEGTWRRTVQWSQRPHFARSGFYEEILRSHFRTDEHVFIEDRMHSVATHPDHHYNIVIYTPEGNMQRSIHLDGRRAQ